MSVDIAPDNVVHDMHASRANNATEAEHSGLVVPTRPSVEFVFILWYMYNAADHMVQRALFKAV